MREKTMKYSAEDMLSNLHILIANLGKRGGLMSPSVYDTAQTLRFYSPASGINPALDWLIGQQQADGGWGDPSMPQTRDVPTLASILALYTYNEEIAVFSNIARGLDFLRQQAIHWCGCLSDDIPVGIELILPRLLEDAARLGLDVPHRHYKSLIPLGNKKRQYIQQLNPGAATPPAFSWEAWGIDPDPKLLDKSGGVGHSPAATAYWLFLAGEKTHLADARSTADKYLAKASQATGTGIPGVMPTAWPIDRYEQAFVLHTLLVADLLDHPFLQDVVAPQLDDLAASMTPRGLGFSDYFLPDGDNTAAAVATLKAAGYPTLMASLQHFMSHNHFIGYHGELQTSHSLTARAVHALIQFEEDVSPWQGYLIERQLQDGRWAGDKWHTSWLYSTLLAAFALKQSGPRYSRAIQAAINVIQANQNQDGGWGAYGLSMVTDTAYGALTLYVLRESGQVSPTVLQAAHQWLLNQYRPFHYHQAHSWLNKQQYAPYRIDWGFELSALLAVGEVISA
jgi:hypothetical protein